MTVAREPRVGQPARVAHPASSWRGATIAAIAQAKLRLDGIILVSADVPELRAHTGHICDCRLADARYHLDEAAKILNPE